MALLNLGRLPDAAARAIASRNWGQLEIASLYITTVVDAQVPLKSFSASKDKLNGSAEVPSR